MRQGVVVWVAMAAMLAAGAAWGADTNLTVTARVNGTCMFTGTTNMAFGNLDPSATPTDALASGTATYWCTKGIFAAISTDDGLHNLGTQKRMAGPPPSFLPYQILSLVYDASPMDGPTATRTVTINGQILGTDIAAAAAGDYSDTLVVTVVPAP